MPLVRTLALVLLSAAFLPLRAETPVYVEAAVGALMPGGSCRLSRSPLWAVRAGVSASDSFNLEAEFGEARVNAFSARALWRPLGYERFDPFLSLGAGAFGNSSWRAGPEFGLGFLYYVGDHLALRADLRTCLTVDGAVEPISSALAGVSWTF